MIQTSSGASATSHLPRRAEIGLAHALGAICDGEGTNFAVYAGNAEEIDLCLFDATGDCGRAALWLSRSRTV
jgi:pullulanase/glycogen debranching enzyme